MPELPDDPCDTAYSMCPELETYRIYAGAVAEAFDIPRPGWFPGEVFCIADHPDGMTTCPHCRAAI